MTFDWHMLYPLHTVIFDNSQVFGGVPCKAQLCNFSKWFFSPRFGVVPIWEPWQFCYVRIEPPKSSSSSLSSASPSNQVHNRFAWICRTRSTRNTVVEPPKAEREAHRRNVQNAQHAQHT